MGGQGQDSRGASPDAAPPQLFEPPPHLLVVMQVRPSGLRPQIDPIEEIKRPAGQIVPLEFVIEEPTPGPQVSRTAAHPPTRHGSEPSLDLIQIRLVTATHGRTVSRTGSSRERLTA